jgi:hypothetical protein
MTAVDVDSDLDRSAIVGGDNTVNRADINAFAVAVKNMFNAIFNGTQEWAELTVDPSAPPAGTIIPFFKAGRMNLRTSSAVVPVASASPSIVEGRLSFNTTLSVPDSDASASGAATLYLHQHKGNQIAVWNGTAWVYVTIPDAGVSIALPATTNTNYDVFVQDNGSGVASLVLLAWTNNTTRATALTKQNGVYVRTGTLTQRYMGTVRTAGVAGQSEDTQARRFLWNYYHRVLRKMKVIDTTDSWAYTTATWRPLNNDTTNRLEYVTGVMEDMVKAKVIATVQIASSATVAGVGIDLDGTTANEADVSAHVGLNVTTNAKAPSLAERHDFSVPGYHFMQAMEIGGAGSTFYGDNTAANFFTGIVGEIWC